MAKECGLHDCLDEDERYVADGTYRCPQAIFPDEAVTDYQAFYMRLCRSRHEATNNLFKRFNVVKNIFSRHPSKHGLFLHSIAQIVQLGIMIGEMQASFAVQLEEPRSWPGTWE
jgi:hypothetical protein